MEQHDPNRPKLRVDKLEARCVQPNTDVVTSEPTTPQPATEKLDPSRPHVRSEKLLPQVAKLMVLKELPSRA